MHVYVFACCQYVLVLVLVLVQQRDYNDPDTNQ